MTVKTLVRPVRREAQRTFAARLVNGLDRAPLHLAILLICAVWMIPTIGLLVSSFRPADQVATTGWWTAFKTPFAFTLENYQQVFTSKNIGLSFVNSLIISIPATIMPIMVAAYAAYALAWMQFPGRNLLFVSIVALLIVPLQVTLVPVLRLFTGLGITGTFLAIWLAHTGYGLPFAIYLLRNFFSELPGEMFEAASIDGASPFVAFYRLAVPTSVPALASLAIFQFMWVWNDLLAALIYLGGRPSVAPLTVTLSNLVSSHAEGWPLLTAAAFISMLLPLIIFFTCQRYSIRGIVAGSVKG